MKMSPLYHLFKKENIMPKPETRYVVDYTITAIKQNNMGICEGTTRIAASSCEVDKMEAANLVQYLVNNGIHELKKNKARIVLDG